MSHSTVGRKRRLTDAQVAAILKWHGSKCTNAEMAARFGISRKTLELIVRTRGEHYKKSAGLFAPKWEATAFYRNLVAR